MSLKVIYLYMSQGSAPPNSNVKWDPKAPCAKRFVERMTEDGSFVILSELKRKKVIDELLVFYESNRGPGFANWGKNVFGWVCPEISFVERFIDSNTVIYARGGFRGWFSFLTSHKNKNWLMCYNANTGRERWTFWDIILWDLHKDQHIDRHGRLWYHYIKPVDETTFRPLSQKLIFDVCIGASHIHDKKGQWRAIDVLSAYKRKYGINLRAVLPGWGNRGVKTAQIGNIIDRDALSVVRTGMLPRPQLSKDVFNRSRCALFLGTHGQGDRGPLEALACGVPIMIGNKRYHSPYVYSKNVAVVPEDQNDADATAELLYRFLNNLPSRSNVYTYFRKNLGFYEVCYPNLQTVFDFIRENRKPTLDAKKELLENARKRTEQTRV